MAVNATPTLSQLGVRRLVHRYESPHSLRFQRLEVQLDHPNLNLPSGMRILAAISDGKQKAIVQIARRAQKRILDGTLAPCMVFTWVKRLYLPYSIIEHPLPVIDNFQEVTRPFRVHEGLEWIFGEPTNARAWERARLDLGYCEMRQAPPKPGLSIGVLARIFIEAPLAHKSFRIQVLRHFQRRTATGRPYQAAIVSDGHNVLKARFAFGRDAPRLRGAYVVHAIIAVTHHFYTAPGPLERLVLIDYTVIGASNIFLGETRGGRPDVPEYLNSLHYPERLAVCDDCERPTPNRDRVDPHPAPIPSAPNSDDALTPEPL